MSGGGTYLKDYTILRCPDGLYRAFPGTETEHLRRDEYPAGWQGDTGYADKRECRTILKDDLRSSHTVA